MVAVAVAVKAGLRARGLDVALITGDNRWTVEAARGPEIGGILREALLAARGN